MPFRLILLILALLAPCTHAQPATPSPKPNLVLILADDLGFSDLGCYGSEIPTPNLDRLAREGLRFTNFYNTGRCCPSRASVLTGLYPHQAGVGHMVDAYAKPVRDQLDSPAYTDHLSERCLTIAEILRDAGYRTMMSGKWHLGYRRGEYPDIRGFRHSYCVIDGAMNYFGQGPQHTADTSPPMVIDGDPYDPPREGFFSTDAFTDSAINFLRNTERSGQPFFLYLAYNAPHWPLHALPRDIARHRGKYRNGWESIRKARHQRLIELGIIDPTTKLAPPDHGNVKPWDQLTDDERDQWDLKFAIYAAQVEHMDRAIGRLLNELRLMKQDQNTLLLFLSDNGGAAENPNKSRPGATLGSRDSYVGYGRPWATVSSTPFRLHKATSHEGGIATPAILHWPGKTKSPGSLTPQLAHLIDVLPTFLAAAGVVHPRQRDGEPAPPPEGLSLLPLLSGDSLGEGSANRTLYFEHQGSRAVRAGNWKLVSLFNKPWELYDLSADRTELDDLSAKHPDRVQELSKRYDEWADRVGAKPWPGNRN